MSEKWWRATTYSLKEVAVSRVTDKFVFIDGTDRREMIDVEGCHYARSKKEAIEKVIVELNEKISACRGSIKYYEEQISKLELNKTT